MEPSQQATPHSSPDQTNSSAPTKNAGRKKIRIIRITDSRSRQVTFLKRKNGLLKKAHELSILCGCNVAVVIFNNDNGKLYEYFNPSAEETFNRYAVYTGVSERRRSDVTQLEEAKGSCDIPNEEPEVAEAALAPANMSAIRHAHPENYEYPPPGRSQIHPNVMVPAIRMPAPPVPARPAMRGSSSRNSIAGPSSRPLLLHTPTTEEPPRVGQTPGSAHSHRNTAERNYSRTAAGTSQAIRPIPFHLEEPTITPKTDENQMLACFGLPSLASNEQSQQRPNVTVPAIRMPPAPAPLHRAMSGSSSQKSIAGPSSSLVLVHTAPSVNSQSADLILHSAHDNDHIAGINSSSAQSATLEATRPLRFHSGEQAVNAQTVGNEMLGFFELPSLGSNEQPLQPGYGRDTAGGAILEPYSQRNSTDSSGTLSIRAHDGLSRVEGERGSKIDGGDVPMEREMLTPNPLQSADRVSSGRMGAEMQTSNNSMDPTLLVSSKSSLPSPPSTVTPSSGPRSTRLPPETIRTPAAQPWKSPFFRQQMQEAERMEAQPVLPPLTPLLGYLPVSEYQPGPFEVGTGNLQNRTGFDAIPEFSDMGLIPENISGIPVTIANSDCPAGTVRKRGADGSWGDGGYATRQRRE